MTTSFNQSILEKSIIIVNCPIECYGEYIVSASCSLFQSNLYLSIYIFDNTSSIEPIKLIAQIPISKIFTSIEWTSLGKNEEEHSFGFIIGGHEDGSISLWDMTKIIKNIKNTDLSQDFGCISQKKLFENSINVLALNENPNLFAIGTTQVNIVSINQNYQMTIEMSCPPPEKGGFFTSLNWNDKVNHILSSATDKGNIYIYDMKKNLYF